VKKASGAYYSIINPNSFLFTLIIIFILVFGAASIVAYHHYKSAVLYAIAENKSTANLFSALIYEHQKATIGILESHALRPLFIDAVQKRDFHHVLYHLKSLNEHHTEIDALFITDQYGTLWANYPVAREGFGKSLAHRDWYKGVSKNWRPYISSVYRLIVLEKGLAVALSVPVLDRKGNIIGILSGAHRTAFLATFIRANTLDSRKSITLLDQEGNIIFSNAVPYQEKITKYPEARVLEKALAGVVIDMEIADAKEKGSLSYVSIAPIRGIGWSVIVGEEKNAVLKSLYRYFILSAVAGFVIFLFLTVSLLYFRREYKYRKTKELLQAEEKYRNIFNDAILGIYQTTPEGRFLSANPALARMYGYDTPEELINNVTDLATQSYINPEDREIFKRILLREGVVEKFETPLRKKGGETIWVSINAHTVKDTQGNISCYEGTIENITERKQAEEALRKSHEKLIEAHRLAHIGVWNWVAETDTVLWTEELYRIAGLDPMLPAPTYAEHPNIYAPESWDLLKEAVERAMKTGEPYNLELKLIRPDGTTRWVNAFGGATYDNHGRIEGLQGTVHDITERKHAEEEKRRLEERSRKVVEDIFRFIPEGVLVFSRKMELLRQNQAFRVFPVRLREKFCTGEYDRLSTKKEDNRWNSSSQPAQDQTLKKFNSDLSDGVRCGSVARPSRRPYGKTRYVFAPITPYAKYLVPCIWVIKP